ncbi:MAG: hypothetical protein KIT17_03000 [Rubrivivax sp.]|nr:hypothetical protein [Rubrivivax sp.]
MASPAAPFVVGFAFRQGDIPSGSYITASIPEVQATVKNRWPDGSVKFAVIAGRAALASSTPSAVALNATGVAPGGAALTLADLKATGVTAAVSAGGFGTANWSGTDWDTPAQTWVSGPFMSSWIYRRQIGSDAHLVAWLEVRLFLGGAVEVLPWVENGYLRVAGPTAKSATYTFTLGGTQRFSAPINLLNHQRTPLVAGTALSHWLGTDPAVTLRHDAAYLQSTRLVPRYWASVSPSAGAVTSLPSTYVPLQLGSLPSAMGAAGYDPSIGLLPEWEVLYLTSTASTVWAAVQRNAYSAGRFGIHFRDESTHRPLRFSAYPNLVLDGSSGVTGTGSSSTNSYTPAAGGGSPPTYTNTHCPSLGYFAYLVTGRPYHLETAQFQATAHFLKNNDTSRGYTAGVLRTNVGANTTRGAAWSLRTLAQAAAITPDGDALQAELIASVEANLNYYHGRYVAQPNNPFGFVTPYTDYTSGDNITFGATWQQDFFTAAIGMMKALRLPLSSSGTAKLDAFFAWKARSVVGRFGGTGSTEFLYRDAASYTIAEAPSDNADWTGGSGPWYASWGAIYDATYASASPGSRVDGALRGAYFPEATSYWGNLQPALAYAVEHGVPGAQEAYNRMTGASNWSQLQVNFNSAPVWGVRPG